MIYSIINNLYYLWLARIFQASFIILTLFLRNNHVRQSEIFQNTHSAFTKLKGLLKTSVLDHFIVLHSKGVQNILINWQCYVALITSLLCPFIVPYKTDVTNSLKIKGPRYYFFDIWFVLLHNKFFILETKSLKDDFWFGDRRNLMIGFIQS